MTPERTESLLRRWQERLDSAVEQLAGPLDALLMPFDLSKGQQAQTKDNQAAEHRNHSRWSDESQPTWKRSRRLLDWSWGMRTHGRMGR